MTYEQAMNGRDKIRKVVKFPINVVIKRIFRSNQFYLDVRLTNKVSALPIVLKYKYQIDDFIERHKGILTAEKNED